MKRFVLSVVAAGLLFANSVDAQVLRRSGCQDACAPTVACAVPQTECCATPGRRQVRVDARRAARSTTVCCSTAQPVAVCCAAVQPVAVPVAVVVAQPVSVCCTTPQPVVACCAPAQPVAACCPAPRTSRVAARRACCPAPQPVAVCCPAPQPVCCATSRNRERSRVLGRGKCC